MSVQTVHPLYSLTIVDQLLLRHSYGGQRVVKDQGETYLPPTKGMVIDGMASEKDDGSIAYKAYIGRAVYPSVVSDAVEALLGLMHQNPATIELPDGMLPMLERATADGEGLQSLLKRINEQQLVTGRVGAMLDLPTTPDPAKPFPFIALYNGEAITNWDDSEDNIDFNKLKLVVLNESRFERDQFTWTFKNKYRVLSLGDPSLPEEPNAKYNVAIIAQDGTLSGASWMTPKIRGKSLETVPFVFINTKDNLAKPDNPPLLGLADLAMTIYKGEADYRQALYMQSQDTLVVVGGMKTQWNETLQKDEEVRIGAGSRIDLDLGGSAEFIGTSSLGLPEMRTALENDYKRATAKSGQLIDAMGSKQESGEALQTRLSAQTATLNQIADCGARGLQNLLRIAAEWLSLDPNKVVVTPNKEFTDQTISGKDLLDLVAAKNQGAPLSKETIHAIAAERGLTKFTFEEEMGKISEEDPLLGTPVGAITNLTLDAQAQQDGKKPAAKDEE